MSFLTQGKWTRPALALGFDPVAVAQRALVTGAIKLGNAPASAPVSPSPKPTRRGRRLRHPDMAHLKGNAYRVEWNRRHRAALVRAGLTTEGKPRTNRRHPQLRGLKGRAYLKAWQALQK
ncbi:MAG: hypothetical protein RJB26_263 [Pseudomonadota bacterium]|jgi:hypothetical protein